MLCYHAALLAWLCVRTSVMYSFPISAWFHRIIASISGVSTPIIRAMSTKVHRPKGRSVSKNLCYDERERAREREREMSRESAREKVRLLRCCWRTLSVGTTPPSTVVYGILCLPKARFVRTEVTVSHLHVICVVWESSREREREWVV